MASTAPSLADALRGVEATVALLNTAALALREAPEADFRRLRAAAASFDTATRVRVPIGIERFVAQWQAYNAGSANEISAKAVRALCWHPETALQASFLRYLDAHPSEINGRALEGLTRSCFSLWARAHESGAVRAALSLLAAYSGRRRVLLLWKEAALLHVGPELLSEEMVGRGIGPDEIRDRWRLGAQDEFLQEGVCRACDACLDAHGRHTSLMVSKLLPWRDFAIGRFRSHFAASVLHPAAEVERFREALLSLVRADERLGDPRLPWNQPHWAELRSAERRVVEWLSQLDIQFFFDHVLPSKSDRHGRKAFWLQYVGSVRRSRPLLCDEDRRRLSRTLADAPAAAAGRVSGQASAFLLDFGALLVIEFARAGNACYIYEAEQAARVVNDFWRGKAYSPALLKEARLACAHITHYPPGQWQDKTAALLASYGIRP